jgi:uncharacterized repeat protein (TIGR04042 family)
MPVTHFRIQWPDGSEEVCYSPSSVVRDFFTVGQSYAVADFVARSREALHLASERVRAKYGFACSAALDQLAEVEAGSAPFINEAGAAVKLLHFIES